MTTLKQQPDQGIYLDVSNNEYHHTEKYTMLSSGGIRTLIDKSPSHLKAVFESTEESKNPNFIFGSAAHSYILEPEKNNVIVEPLVDKRTKDGKTEYTKFEESIKDKKDAIVISFDSMKIIEDMKTELFKNKMLSELLTGGKFEVTGIWDDPVYDFKCKLRNDYWLESLNLIIDYKTAADASLEGFSKAVFNHGYHIQAQWYKTGMKIITGIDHDFIFVVQEKTPPYSVAIYNASMDICEIAESQIKKAKQIYADCLKKNEWPSYPKEIQQIIVPSYIRSKI